jgi:hypothetical protein
MKFSPPPSRGFVLSMSIFMMAVFLLLFAQIYTEHLHDRQLDKTSQWNQFHPFHLAMDAKRDLNHLLDQRIYVTQDSQDIHVSIRGKLPSPLNMTNNLLRYQDDLQAWAQDQNIYAFIDLNETISDGNIHGRMDHGYEWKEKLNTSRIHFYPTDENVFPTRIDINISAESSYSETTPWSLGVDGDTYVVLRYTDQNTSHTTTSSGHVTLGETETYAWRYSSGLYGITLEIGLLNDTNGSLVLDNNGSSSFTATYSMTFTFDANTTPSRIGYVLPLTVIGKDANVVQDVQWIYE